MKKLTFIVLTVALVATSGYAGWWKTYGDEGYDVGNCVQITKDGKYVIAGKSSDNLWILKTDTSGGILWENKYGSSPGNFRWIEETKDGGFIVAPQTPSLLKINANGDTLWTKEYGVYSYCVQPTDDEGYIVTAGSNGVGYDPQLILIKTNDKGDTLWTRTYAEPGNNRNSGYFIQNDLDGGYIITGLTGYSDDYVDYSNLWLLKTDKEGNKQWSQVYGNDDLSRGFCVRATSDGGYVITGLKGFSPNGLWLLKTSSLGDTLWTKVYGYPIGGEGYSVQVTLDGAYIVVGTTDAVFLNADRKLCLLKTNSQGDTLWTRIYGDQIDGDIGYCVQPTPDEGYIITGVRNNDLYLLKTDSLGLLSIGESSDNLMQNCDIACSIGSEISLRYQNCPGSFNVSVFDVAGRQIDELQLVETSCSINLGGNYPSGVYFIQVKTKNTTQTKRVVIVH